MHAFPAVAPAGCAVTAGAPIEAREAVAKGRALARSVGMRMPHRIVRVKTTREVVR